MKLTEEFLTGTFLKRKSRFSALVLIDGEEKYVHVPNSGRLKELLTPQRKVILRKAKQNYHRKTKYSISMVEYQKGLVSIESLWANKLFEEALTKGMLLSGYKILKREAFLGTSRIDFMLENPNGKKGYAEVKSVTLVKDGIALFPDAPTHRGRKHIQELINAIKEGLEAFVIFVVQRIDAHSFAPNDAEDPSFGKILREAHQRGVKIYAYKCKINLKENKIIEEIPTLL